MTFLPTLLRIGLNLFRRPLLEVSILSERKEGMWRLAQLVLVEAADPSCGLGKRTMTWARELFAQGLYEDVPS